MVNTKKIMEQKTPRQILSQFYIDNNLPPDGGQSCSSVKIELTKKISFYFPNFDERRRAVIKHDIHHLVTGYKTNITGESEISAWEIGSNCKTYWAAFLIDTSGLMIGLPFNFWGVLKAFAKGRKTKNLYHDTISMEESLDMPIEELKIHLGLTDSPENIVPNIWDFILFSFFVLFGTIYSILALVLLPYIIVYSIYIGLKNK